MSKRNKLIYSFFDFCIINYLLIFYFSESTESEEAAALRRQLKTKKNQLRSLLSKPIFPRGFSGKYLDDNLNIDIVQDAQKAIEVMKKVIEDNADKSKDNNTVFQKRQHSQESKRFKKLKKT